MPFLRPLRFEQLEDKTLFAVVWANEHGTGANDPNFQVYGPDEILARAIVNRAIDDWNAVIPDQNYDNDDDPEDGNGLSLVILASNIGSQLGYTNYGNFTDGSDGWTPNVPTSAAIHLDDDGSGVGWFFDPTPLDDAEFSGIAAQFDSKTVDVSTYGQSHLVDFYDNILHEIGHALGLFWSPAYSGAITNYIADFDPPRYDGNYSVGTVKLKEYHNLQTTFRATLTEFGGGHLYEGHVNDLPGLLTHPNDLMNPGRTINPLITDPHPMTRRLISDIDVGLLADAYGYTVNVPSTLNTAYVTLDSQTGTLLVQGLPGAVVDDIDVNLINGGADVQVMVNGATEVVAAEDVVKIVVAGNGGNDAIDVAPGLAGIWQLADYVISSNQDAVDSGTLGDGLVDLDDNVPGNQVTLRAAVQEANYAGNKTIYVPRGNYDLALTGSGGDAQGDLDITKEVTVVGAGPGATVITAPTDDRHFEVESTGKLTVERLTLTGGSMPGVSMGAAIYVNSRASSTGGDLVVNEAAVVNNGMSFAGGAIFVGAGAEARIDKSVVANDSAHYGGGIAADASSSGYATVTLAQSIVTNNATTMGDPDLTSGVSGANVGLFVSEGYNLIGEIGGANFSPLLTDHESPTGQVDYVVTSVVDTFDLNHGVDDPRLSLREAVNLANNSEGDEIWLPAWSFALTLESDAAGDHGIGYGDLDITKSLTIRIAGSAGVQVRQTVEKYQDSDAVFDLWGDFNGDGESDANVDGSDFLIWQQQNGMTGSSLAADANDDGDVDSADYDIWDECYGNSLELIEFGQ